MEDYSFEVPYPRELMFRQNRYAVICQIRQIFQIRQFAIFIWKDFSADSGSQGIQKEFNIFYQLIPQRVYQNFRKVAVWVLSAFHLGGTSNKKPKDFEIFLINDAYKKIIVGCITESIGNFLGRFTF